jgi:hypothetical protein
MIAPACAPVPEFPRDDRAEFQYPTPNRLIGEVETALGQELLDVAIAQREPQIEPDRMLNDRRREAMPAIGEDCHAQSYLAAMSATPLM